MPVTRKRKRGVANRAKLKQFIPANTVFKEIDGVVQKVFRKARYIQHAIGGQ